MRPWIGAWAALGLAAIALPAAAQSWPAKPVRLVIPYAPGGIADIAARIVGAKLTEIWGQQAVIENKPGGNGFIGVTTVTKAAPDGYTLLVGTVGDFTINPALFKDMPYNAESDLVPITGLTDTPCVITVNIDAPYKSMADLYADAKTKPGKIPYATPGNGSINQLLMEWIGVATGTSYQHIPYKGGAPAGAAVAAGDVPVGVLAVSSAMPHLKSGRARIIAITSAERSKLNPEWPTLIEGGAAGVSGSNWTALLAPKGTSQALVDKIHGDVVKVLAMAEVKERLAGGGAVVIPSTPAELADRFKKEAAAYKVIVEKAKITAQ